MRTILPDRERFETNATDFFVRLAFLAFLALFAWWSLELVRPIAPIVIRAVLLTVALYPAYAWLARRFGGRRGLAAFASTATALATVLGPVSALAASLAETVQWLAAGLNAGTLRLPPPPAGLDAWPVVGEPLVEAWTLAAGHLEQAVLRYGPAVLPAGGTVLAKEAAISLDLVKFVASVVISGFLLLPGPRLAAGARAFASRLLARRGAQFVDLAGATIRNVPRGVIGVALLQALLAGVILYLAGIPSAGLIAVGILLLCIVQIGPAPILLPLLVWVSTTHPATVSLVLALLLVPVALLDNVLKPILMAQGLTAPMLVILTGAIGGAIAYGLVGLFLGPVVLSVFYEPLVAWNRLGNAPAAQPPASGAA